MAQSRVSAKGYIGIPALIFIEFVNYNRGAQSYLEKRTILHKIYGYLRGYLPVIYEKDNKTDEFNKDIIPLLNELSERFSEVRHLYKPSFESIQTYDPDESVFDEKLDGVFEKLAEISAITKVIDNTKTESEEVFF